MDVILLMVSYSLIKGKDDEEISEKIVKESLKFPINIPYSKSLVNLLKGLLEKNPQLRIELNSNLISEWLEDTTELIYKTSKIKKSDIVSDNNNKFSKDIKQLDADKLNTLSNKELFENVMDLDVIVRDPAKFEQKDDESQKSKYNTYDFNKKSIKTDKRNSIIPSPDKERDKNKRYSTIKPTFTITDKYKK